MAINSYTSDDSSLKIEINDSSWTAKAIDLDNNNDTYTLDMSADDAEELDGFIHPGFAAGKVMLYIARKAKEYLV